MNSLEKYLSSQAKRRCMKQVEERSNSVSDFLSSLKNVWFDSRIPSRDRWVIGFSLFLILSPLDLLPDMIPVIGVIDDLILLSFVLDYFFNRLDENIILDHFEGGRKRFYTTKAFVGRLCKISPQHVLHFLWKYEKPTKNSYQHASNSSTTNVKNVN